MNPDDLSIPDIFCPYLWKWRGRFMSGFRQTGLSADVRECLLARGLSVTIHAIPSPDFEWIDPDTCVTGFFQKRDGLCRDGTDRTGLPKGASIHLRGVSDIYQGGILSIECLRAR